MTQNLFLFFFKNKMEKITELQELIAVLQQQLDIQAVGLEYAKDTGTYQGLTAEQYQQNINQTRFELNNAKYELQKLSNIPSFDINAMFKNLLIQIPRSLFNNQSKTKYLLQPTHKGIILKFINNDNITYTLNKDEITKQRLFINENEYFEFDTFDDFLALLYSAAENNQYIDVTLFDQNKYRVVNNNEVKFNFIPALPIMADSIGNYIKMLYILAEHDLISVGDYF